MVLVPGVERHGKDQPELVEAIFGGIWVTMHDGVEGSRYKKKADVIGICLEARRFEQSEARSSWIRFWSSKNHVTTGTCCRLRRPEYRPLLYWWPCRGYPNEKRTWLPHEVKGNWGDDPKTSGLRLGEWSSKHLPTEGIYCPLLEWYLGGERRMKRSQRVHLLCRLKCSGWGVARLVSSSIIVISSLLEVWLPIVVFLLSSILKIPLHIFFFITFW